MASAVVSVNKSISANLGLQMVQAGLHIPLWQMEFVIDLTLRWTTQETHGKCFTRGEVWDVRKR